MQGGKSKPTDAITFKAYITWLLAMLNKDEMWEEAGQAADLLIAYERESSKRKGQKDLNTGRGVQIDQLRNAAGQRAFLNGLVPIMEDATDEVKPKLAAFAKAINAMPSDNFAYYHTLIKLRYAERANLNSTNTSPQLTLS